MKHPKVSIVAVAVIAACLAGLSATSASADPTPQTKDIIGVGSDTTQIAMNAVADGYKSGALYKAGYNATAASRLVSFDAFNPVTGAKGDMITLRVGTSAIARPDGSGAGKALLYGTANNTAINFARSSSALSTAEVAAGLVAYPFALDQVAAGVAKNSTYAPAAISAAQLVKIYDGTYTNWNQLGGADAPITALLPQSGSGTRSFFLAQLKAANGNTDVVLASSVIQTVQEHDASVFAAYTNAVVPFSVGRAALAANTSLVQVTNTGTASDGNAAFNAKRAVYNVVRSADTSKAFVTSLFAEGAYLCGSSAKGAIASGGLTQLASAADGGVCGIPVTTTAGVSNFTTN
ncbi:MAG: substrate-binding domain-containing protein [Actinobacteria bacterium]|nr:substrate-binding domain-containing protein [Actinomycetota bacterium]MCG2798038.1 substrate-binding domain-containing protein [Cellulomonas sp.]